MKFFIICLLLCAMPTASSSAGETEGRGYRVISFGDGLKATFKNNEDWRMCGNYFAELEVPDGKIVYFAFERLRRGNPSTESILAMSDVVSVSINEKAKAPLVAIRSSGLNTKFYLVMNAKDYVAGLPCLSRGTGV